MSKLEKWDIYNQDRIKDNLVISEKTKLKPGQFRLIVHVCIFNLKNEMLIQKRSKNKTLYPNLWDVSVSGSVLAGEDTRMAGERETFEELGYNLSLENERVSMTFNFDEGFDDFFLVKRDFDIKNLNLDKNEVTDVMWASEKEILSMLTKNTFLPYHKSFINLLFFNKDNMKIHTR